MYFYCVAVGVLSWFCGVVVFCHFQFCSHLINRNERLLYYSYFLAVVKVFDCVWCRV